VGRAVEGGGGGGGGGVVGGGWGGGVCSWLLGNSVSQIFELAPRFKENLLFSVTVKD